MKRQPFSTALTWALVASFLIPTPARAARGTPESLEFAYGARIEVQGPQLAAALRLAAEMKLDWVALDFDWAVTWPEISPWNPHTRFATAMNLAGNLGLNVLVSVKNPPAWALTSQGPEPGLSAALVSDLTGRYPHLLAVELYPRANTRAGWGAPPNPAAYANLFQTIQTRLAADQRKVYLIAGGLSNQLTSPDDLADLAFLQGLYQAGARPAILSLQFSSLAGEPLDAPSAASLRHYEQIRSVMTANGQSDGLLWVSRLAPPPALTGTAPQNLWLQQASTQLQTQLYVGAVYYDALNPSAGAVSLIGADLTLHPFLQTLSQLMGRPPVSRLPVSSERTKKREPSQSFAQLLER